MRPLQPGDVFRWYALDDDDTYLFIGKTDNERSPRAGDIKVVLMSQAGKIYVHPTTEFEINELRLFRIS